ncbi:MAG: hypothetical protein HYS27_10785 [Deltaproteobacteria bacterium]|nr:hypothetical protein [Deltaproteobacteria bacterium]
MALTAVGLALLLTPAAAQDEPELLGSRVPVASTAPEAPREPSTAAPPPDERDAEGLDVTIVAALQLAGACATYAVMLPAIGVTSYLCPFMACGACLLPAAAGYAGTWIGDRFGTTRAPAIWPIIASYAGLVVSGVSVGAIYFAAFTGGTQLLALAGGIGVLAGFAASIIGIPIAYALSAEDKRPGDDGDAFPGVFEAAHPSQPGKKRAPAAPGKRPTAPRPPKAPMPDLPTPPLLEPQGALRAMLF